MDPLVVLRSIWRHKWFAVPAILLSIAAAVLVYAFGPREYESTTSFAIVNPTIPSKADIAADPALSKLNANNPYLRSTDPNLVANVVITRLNASTTADLLKSRHLGTNYLASPGVGGAGLIVSITATGDSQRQSLATTELLGTLFNDNLRQIQKVNGADDVYLFTSLVVSEPDRATEKLSSRLRTVVVVGLCGLILIFGSISLGTWIDSARRRRADAKSGGIDKSARDGGARMQSPAASTRWRARWRTATRSTVARRSASSTLEPTHPGASTRQWHDEIAGSAKTDDPGASTSGACCG